MAFWINDLFRSDEVQLLNFVNGEPKPGKMVVITDVNAEYDNNLDSMPRFKFTYTYAQRNHNVLDTARAGRIFDNTSTTLSTNYMEIKVIHISEVLKLMNHALMNHQKVSSRRGNLAQGPMTLNEEN